MPTTISGNSDAATLFGMSPATVTKTIIGRSVASTGLDPILIEVNGVAQNITVTAATPYSDNASIANTELLWVDDGGGQGHLQITIMGDSTTLTLKIIVMQKIGLKTASILAYVKTKIYCLRVLGASLRRLHLECLV